MLFGRVSRKILLAHPKKKFQQVQLSDTTRSSIGAGFYGQIKRKKGFLAANPADVFGTNRDEE